MGPLEGIKDSCHTVCGDARTVIDHGQRGHLAGDIDSYDDLSTPILQHVVDQISSLPDEPAMDRRMPGPLPRWRPGSRLPRLSTATLTSRSRSTSRSDTVSPGPRIRATASRSSRIAEMTVDCSATLAGWDTISSIGIVPARSRSSELRPMTAERGVRSS